MSLPNDVDEEVPGSLEEVPVKKSFPILSRAVNMNMNMNIWNSK
jgi:hypothetical protein